MENYIVNEDINNDFLSQSYSQGIERITGSKDSIFSFQLPKVLLEVREKIWDNLFNKYFKEMSDDVEINVDTLEPEEEEEERAISEEEYSYGQRVPMRKPATLVQYWVNTGNPPYKALLNENELSETDLSLSEKETTSPLASPVTNAINAVNTINADTVDTDKRKHKNDSSCSSVDTAAYILSNANVTKKADAIAIIEGAKYVEVKSLKDVSIKSTRALSNDKFECMETTRIDRAIHGGDSDVNVDVPDIELCPISRTEYTASEICDGAVASTLVSANAIQSNIYSQSSSCEETDKIDESSTSPRNLDVQTIDDIAFIFRQFDKTSKRLIGNDKSNGVSDQDKVLEMDAFRERQMSGNSAREIIAKDTNLTESFHRKKLYTGRDSPVDLILTETHGTSRLAGAKQSLHPALDSDSTIKRKTFLVRKGKNKQSLSAKRSLGSQKVKRKERREPFCTSSNTITDISNKYTSDKIQDSNIDSSFKGLSDFHDNSDRRRDDIPFRECDDTNVSVNNEKCKQNLASLNLEPIVLLERINALSFEGRKLKFDENTHIARKKNTHSDRRLNKFKKFYPCEIENLEVETIDSDQSTILICQCNINAPQHASSLSDCSVDLRLNIEDGFSASNAERRDGKLSSLKDTDMNQNKELRIVKGLPRSLTKGYTNAAMESHVSNKNNAVWQNVLANKSKTYPHLCEKNKIDNVKLREIKVVLERLPLSAKNCTSTMMQMQALNKNEAIWQKEISHKSKAHFSNAYGANKKDNGKLREVRVGLERILPANLKEISNITSTNIFSNKMKISQNTSLQINRACNKRKSELIKSCKILACENETAVRPVRNDYSLRMNTKSKKNNDKIGDTFDIVAESESQIFDNTESNFTFQQKTFRHKNHSETSQNNSRSKYSVLTFTSDEDDFIGSMQHPKIKRSKVSIDDNTLGEPNIAGKNFCDQTKLVNSDKNKNHSGRNLSMVIRSSEKTVQRDIGSIKRKRECSGVEIKSFNNTRTTTNSLRIRKNERFSFFSSEDDNDSAADNSDERRVKISVLDSKEKKINNNSKTCSNGATKENGIDRKDVHVMFFQTKTFDTNSSDSEEGNSYISSTCKALKSSPTRSRLRNRNHADPEKMLNDSIVKGYSKRHLKSLNSSLEKHNRIHDVRTRLRLIDEEAKANERLANEKSNGDIKSRSRVGDTRKDASSSSPISDVRNTCKVQHVQKKKFSNIFLEKTNLDQNLSKNKEISDKSKNSLIVLQSETHVTCTVKKLLTFQTKSYYDSSDSSEIL